MKSLIEHKHHRNLFNHNKFKLLFIIVIGLFYYGLKFFVKPDVFISKKQFIKPIYNQITNVATDVATDFDTSMEKVNNTKEPPKFSLKHIFHHGAGPEHYKVHKRLDITPEYLAKHNLNNFLINKEKRSNLHDNSPLEDIYNEMDWPKSHEDVNPWTVELPIKAQKEKKKAHRLVERHTPNFIESYLDYAIEVKGNPSILNKIELKWTEDDISVPDVYDKDTLVSLALISSNAYVKTPENEDEKQNSDWYDVGEPWHLADNNTEGLFGWQTDGIRGHVFVSNDNQTVVIGIKGTSGAGLTGTGGEETAVNDKINDNLLFSCCCARVGYMWTTVCDCYEKAYTCNQDCLEKELIRQDRYYSAVVDLYKNVTKLYDPATTDIWVTGHSLGGALASLLGRTFGLPVVAFEAPGEMLATKRLHLPQPPGLPKYLENIWHIGNTADPIYMGVCNGASSSCNIAGFAMETACHTGKQCIYDVVADHGWRVSLLNHRIHTVIDEIIMKYNETARCYDQPPCRDCFNWRFVSHDDELPHTSTSIKPTSTTPENSPTETVPPQKCVKRTWYGWCIEWEPVHNSSIRASPKFQNVYV